METLNHAMDCNDNCPPIFKRSDATDLWWRIRAVEEQAQVTRGISGLEVMDRWFLGNAIGADRALLSKGRSPGLLALRTLATKLRIYFLRLWYALNDPAMEEALYDTPLMRRFAQSSRNDATPDEMTIRNFRRLLETHYLAAQLIS